VRRRTRPMGVFSDRTSMDHILFAVFNQILYKRACLSEYVVIG
jgi:hypothetical protein